MIGVLGFWLWGCGSSEPPAVVSVSVTPSVAAGDDATITIAVDHFELRPPSDHMASGLRPADEGAGDAEAGDYPDGGHYHVYLDSTEVNPLMINCPEHCKHPAWQTMVRARIPAHATAGEHKLIVRLNNDGHAALVPHIENETTFTVTSTGT